MYTIVYMAFQSVNQISVSQSMFVRPILAYLVSSRQGVIGLFLGLAFLGSWGLALGYFVTIKFALFRQIILGHKK